MSFRWLANLILGIPSMSHPRYSTVVHHRPVLLGTYTHRSNTKTEDRERHTLIFANHGRYHASPCSSLVVDRAHFVHQLTGLLPSTAWKDPKLLQDTCPSQTHILVLCRSNFTKLLPFFAIWKVLAVPLELEICPCMGSRNLGSRLFHHRLGFDVVCLQQTQQEPQLDPTNFCNWPACSSLGATMVGHFWLRTLASMDAWWS